METLPAHLITSSDEQTWKFDCPVIFLNDWYLLDSRRQIWEVMDLKIADNIYPTLARRDEEYKREKAIEDALFPKLCAVLNAVHRSEHDERFWKIVLGHWFRRYVHLVFNRIRNLEECLDLNVVASAFVFKGEAGALITRDSNSFSWSLQDGDWNDILLGRLFEFLDLIFQMRMTFDLNAPIMQEYALKISPSVDERLVSLGARILSREVYVKNCKGSHEEIWRGIRKSYKSYINKGIRELSHGVITGKEAFYFFDSFRKLHLEVSGRITRSDFTWEIQKSEVLNSSAFLAYIKLGGRIVGCSFIPHNRRTALYAVGAYRRDLTSLNLGHVSQWLAIQHLNSIGVETYRLGHLEVGQGSSNTPKELSITQFKKGFATEINYERLYHL